MSERLLTQREVMDRLRIGPKSLRDLRKSGKLRFINLNYRSIRIRESVLEAFLNRSESSNA